MEPQTETETKETETKETETKVTKAENKKMEKTKAIVACCGTAALIVVAVVLGVALKVVLSSKS